MELDIQTDLGVATANEPEKDEGPNQLSMTIAQRDFAANTNNFHQTIAIEINR